MVCLLFSASATRRPLALKRRKLAALVGLGAYFFSGYSAYSAELCIYPVAEVRTRFTIKDVEGFDNVDTRRELDSMKYQIECFGKPGQTPRCDTTWGGAVGLMEISKSATTHSYAIDYIIDKSGAKLEFGPIMSIAGRVSPLQFVNAANVKSSVGRGRCGSAKPNSWLTVSREYKDDNVYYYKGGVRRELIVKILADYFISPPRSAASGSRGYF